MNVFSLAHRSRSVHVQCTRVGGLTNGYTLKGEFEHPTSCFSTRVVRTSYSLELTLEGFIISFF